MSRDLNTGGRPFHTDEQQTAKLSSVAAGRGAKGGMRPGGTVQGAAFEGAKIWNSEIWPVLAKWRLHCRQ